jgi:hypothetical protein
VLFPVRLTPLVSAALATALVGCRGPLADIGAGSANAARERAETLFSALAVRVKEPVRNTRYDSARVRIANSAFLPGRLFRDTSIWTHAPSESRRQMLVRGWFEDGHYRLNAENIVAAPSQPAESRHVIGLTRLSDDNEYAWDTEVPYAVGTIRAAEVGRFFGAMLSSAEGRDQKSIRLDIEKTLPTASVVLGQLFTIDSIRAVHLADKSTLASFHVRMHPAGVEKKYPNFARYMRQYAVPTRMQFSLTDRDSSSYVNCDAKGDGKLALTLRTLNGRMIPLAGPAKQMPDTLTLNGQLVMKVRGFAVGFHDYHAEMAIVRTDHERAWHIVSRQEPKWRLPLITEHLIGTPLKRPFQGGGASFRIGFRDSTGAQTILNRRLHLVVQESRILRFINRLAGATLGDWVGKAEREQMAWLDEMFTGLVEDVKAIR